MSKGKIKFNAKKRTLTVDHPKKHVEFLLEVNQQGIRFEIYSNITKILRTIRKDIKSGIKDRSIYFKEISFRISPIKTDDYQERIELEIEKLKTGSEESGIV